MEDRPEAAATTEGEPERPPPAPRRRWRRWAAIAVLGLVLVGSLFAVRLATGPLSLPTADRVVYRLLADLAGPGGRVAVGSVAVAFERGRGFVLVVDDLSMTGPAGTLDAPRILLDVSVKALLAGRIVGRELYLHEPVLELAPFAVGPAAGPGPVAGLEALDARLARLSAVSATYEFTRFRLADGRIVMPGGDPRLPPPALTAVDVAADVDPSGAARMAVEGLSASGPWRLALERTVAAEGSRLEASGRNLALVDLLPATGPLKRGFALSPALSAAFGPDGRAEAIDLSLSVADGVMQFGRDPERTLDRLDLSLDWHAGEDAFRLASLLVRAGASRVELAGSLAPPAPGDTAWTYRLGAVEARLAPDDVPGPPLVLQDFSIEGTFDPARSLLTFPRAVAVAPLGVFRAAGSVAVGPDGPTFAGSADIAATTVDTLKRIWPPVTAHDARVWLVNEVHGGVIERARADFALTAEDLDGLPETDFHVPGGTSVSIVFRGGSLAMPGDIPALQRARGTARILDREARLDVRSGVLAVEGRAPVAVEAFSAVVEDMAKRPPPGRIAATVSGTADAIAAIAAGEPVNALDALDIAPDDLSGTVSAELFLAGPFGDPIDPDALDWRVAATLEGVSSKAPVAGQTVSEAHVEVTATPRRFAVAGRARIDGIEAEINYSGLAGGAGTSGNAEIVVTDELLAARGIDLGGRLDGPVRVSVGQGEDGRQTVSADLTGARLSLPEAGFGKAKGEPARLTATIERNEDAVLVRDVVLEAGEARLAGSLALDGEGRLVRADVSELRLSRGDRARATVTRANGGWRVRLDAEEIDGRPILTGLGDGGRDGPPGGGEGPRVSFEGTVARFVGHNGFVLDDLSVEGLARGGSVETLTGAGRLSGGAGASEVGVSVTPIGRGTRKVNVRLGNAGDALRFLGLYARMRGGEARMDVALDGAGAMDGTLTARDFTITDEPRLAELIARASDRLPAGRSTDPRPLAFQTREGAPREMPFESLGIDFSGRDGVVTVKEAILRGQVIGGTADGTFDLEAGRLALAGTVIPAYAINNLFGRLPVVGEILGAGRSGGLIGVTFRLAGSLEEPEVSINPISAVAPGIFRKVFEFN